MYDADTPYTVMHEQKDLFEWTARHSVNLGFDPFLSFNEARAPIMELLGRSGRMYDFGPGPIIWSAKVWKSLEENYLIPNNITFADLIEANGSEFTWYGEWLLHSQAIRLIPKGPLFKNYHYPHQYEFDKQFDYNFDKIAKLYLGIGMQSIYEFNT
jgi:hypothetical protein